MEHDEVTGLGGPGDQLKHPSRASAPMKNSPSSVSTKRMALATACRMASSLTPWRRADRVILIHVVYHTTGTVAVSKDDGSAHREPMSRRPFPNGIAATGTACGDAPMLKHPWPRRSMAAPQGIDVRIRPRLMDFQPNGGSA